MSRPKNKDEYRAELAESFAHVLEEKGLDWKKEWKGSGGNAPHNGITKACYRGCNAFSLSLISMMKGYDDPRWVTMVQIMDKEGKYHPGEKWHLKAGSKATYVEYWFPYDLKEKKALTWEKFKEEVAGGRSENEFKLSTRYTAVFNACDIEGMPEIPASDPIDMSADELVTKLSESMGVPITTDGGDSAYYSIASDSIHLPTRESFTGEYAFNATALHELSHSTGHSSRLNRNMSGFFGTSQYAYEELVTSNNTGKEAYIKDNVASEKAIEDIDYETISECNDYSSRISAIKRQLTPQKGIVNFIYPEMSNGEFYLVRYIASFAETDTQIINLFEEDNNRCFLTSFSNDQRTLIGMMHDAMCRAHCYQGQYRLFFEHSIVELLAAIEMKYGFEKHSNVYIHKERIEGAIEIVSNIFKEYSHKKISYIYNLFLELNDYLSKVYFDNMKILDDEKIYFNSYRDKELCNGILLKMKAEGKVTAKWKREFSLYVLLSHYYEDVKYQYRCAWLDKQSLDIYIPSMRLGIEYQGQQHFFPVEIFGGEEGFKRTKERDSIKREKCKSNNITLIEWDYKKTINSENLKSELSRYGIELPHKLPRDYAFDNGYLKEEQIREAETLDEIVKRKDYYYTYCEILKQIRRSNWNQAGDVWYSILEVSNAEEGMWFLKQLCLDYDNSEKFLHLAVTYEKIMHWYFENKARYGENHYRKLLSTYLKHKKNIEETSRLLKTVCQYYDYNVSIEMLKRDNQDDDDMLKMLEEMKQFNDEE